MSFFSGSVTILEDWNSLSVDSAGFLRPRPPNQVGPRGYVHHHLVVAYQWTWVSLLYSPSFQGGGWCQKWFGTSRIICWTDHALVQRKAPTQLFIDGESLLSQEGTTQGDPLTMQMYTLATVPLIRRLPDSVTQVWYADDATTLRTLSQLRLLWDAISENARNMATLPTQ